MKWIALAATAMLLTVVPATAAPAERCVTVYDWPDMGLTYCVDANGDCIVEETRTTKLGTQTRCIVADPDLPNYKDPRGAINDLMHRCILFLGGPHCPMP